MDATGIAYLAVAIVIFVAVFWGVYKITHGAPRSTTLIIGACLFFGTLMIGDPSGSRFGHLVTGVIQLSGFALIIVGIIRCCRKAPKKTEDNDSTKKEDGSPTTHC